MAKVKIKVPNIGEIEADNFATEETLLRLIDAVNKSEKTKRQEEKKVSQEREREAKLLKDGNNMRRELSAEEQKAQDRAKKWEDAKAKMSAAGERAWQAGVQSFGSLTTTVGSLGKTALSVGVQMATMATEMSQDPIRAAKGLVDTYIDAGATIAKGAVDLTTGLLGAVPGLGGVAEGLDRAAKAAIELAAQFLHIANEIMAKEFEKSTRALDQYTKSGASFAGGMMEMRTMANDAGLSLELVANAAKGSADEFRAAGLTQGEGAALMAKGAKGLATTVGKSGASIRNELLAMGYSYQEQMEIQSQYMAQIKATGRDLKNITPEELARGTREYAANLKVISDITGQDAKKLMDKARQESLRGALMGKLDAKQQEAYKSSYAAMMAMGPEMGPKLQQALTQVLAGGPVTDPIIAGNKDIMDMINKTAGQVNTGNANMAVETQKNLGDASKAMKDHGENATDQAALFGGAVDGVISGMAQMQNAFKAYQYDPDAAEKSKKAAEAQASLANTTGSVEQGFAKVNEAAQRAAVTMEQLAGSHLGDYATLLANTMEQTVKAFEKGINAINDLIGGSKKADLAPSRPKATTAGNTEIGSKVKLDSDEVAAAKEALAHPEGLGKSDIEYYKKLIANQHGSGGISNTPGIFAEDGPEAAVPLPDGKTIPVTLKDISGSKKDDTQAKLLEKVTSAQENSLKLITNARADIATLAQSSIANMKGMFDSTSDNNKNIATLAQSSIDSVKNMSDSSMQNMLESNAYSKDNLISFAQASIASMKNIPNTNDIDKKSMEAQMASYAELQATSKFLMDEASGRNNSIAVQTNVNQKTLDAIQALVDAAEKMARDNPEMKKQYDKEEENMFKQTAANKAAFDKFLNGDSNDDEKHNELLGKFDEMIGHLRDGNDTSKKLLNVSM